MGGKAAGLRPNEAAMLAKMDAKKPSTPAPIGLAVPEALPAHIVPIWAEMLDSVGRGIGAAGMEALCIQVHRMRDAQRRVTEEGEVVADSKGNPVPHPALAIEQKAGAEVRTWIKTFPPPRKW